MKICLQPARQTGIFLLLTCLSFNVIAQSYVPSAKNSRVEFRIYAHKNGDQLVKGLFTGIKGNIIFNPKQLEKSSFDLSVNAASISTASQERDKEIQSAHFLSAALFPEIKIKSVSITSDGSVVYILHGNLTIKGITKPVNIQFTATPDGNGYLFRGSFQVNRLLYNIGEKGDIDN